MNIHLTKKSSNKKTGKIPVSTTDEESCPDLCPWKKCGCYAKYGPLGIHWRRVNNNEANVLSLEQFCYEVSSFEEDQVWRHNQAGDLPGKNAKIDGEGLKKIVRANRGKRGFTYTHKPVLKTRSALNNRRAIKSANQNGFTINLSANNINEVDTLANLNIGPVTTILPSDSDLKLKTPEGRTVIVCPAEYEENTNCSNCKLCAIPNRKSVIGFRAHGSAKKSINEALKIIC